MTLSEVIANLDTYDPEHTIYAAKPWTEMSEVVVMKEPDDGSILVRTNEGELAYFLK